MATLNDAARGELVAENKCFLDECMDRILIDSGYIRRYWPDIRREDVDGCSVYLRTYTSAKNASASTSVTDPAIQKNKSKAGTFDNVSVGLHRLTGGDHEGDWVLAQVLRRRGSGMRVPFPSERGTLQDEDSLLYKRTSDAVEAPASGRRGIYRASNSINEDDATYDGLLQYATGKAEQVAWQSTRGALLNRERGLYQNQDAAIIAPQPGRGGVYDVTNQTNQFGLYNSELIYDSGVAQNVTFQSRSTFFHARTMALYMNNALPIDAPAIAGTGIYVASNSINRLGFYDSSLTYGIGTGTGQAVFASRRSALRAEEEAIYRHSNVLIEAPTSGQGGIYGASNRLTDEGTYDSNMMYRRSIEKSFTVQTRETPLGQDAARMYRNSRAAITAPSVTGVGIYSANSVENEDGTYDGNLIYRRSIEKDLPFTQGRSTLSLLDARLYRGSRAIIEAPTAGIGGFYRVSNSMDQDGSYSGQLIYGASVEDNMYLPWLTTHGAAALWIYRNTHAIPTALIASLTTGSNNSVSPVRNQDGTYDVTIKSTPTAGSGVDWWDDEKYRWGMYDTNSDTGHHMEVYVYQTTSFAKAAAFMSQPGTGQFDLNRPGTDMRYAGSGRWMCRRLRRVAAAIT
ncbi:MAG: hypothetical protein ACYTEQ_03625 [Planctomycetota bacterium]